LEKKKRRTNLLKIKFFFKKNLGKKKGQKLAYKMGILINIKEPPSKLAVKERHYL
jgi:hypothetical protein